MTALALPERGGDLAQLRQFINIATDDDYLLLVAWLVAALRPAGPYPILTFVSEQGSGKSTACAFVRQLVDPSVAPLRSLPRSERDLAISASNSWLLAYDNVSGISAPMSDALCRLSTGGGFSCRALYSDADEVIFEAQRPILLNGIDDIGVRPDLGERCLLLSLEPIADNARKEEQRLRADFAAALPGLLGALLTVAQRAFVVAPLVRLASRPRMADFATLGAAVAVALGRPEASFLEAYMRNALCITGAALDAHPVAHAVIALMEGASHWKGTPTELYGLFKRGASEDARRSEQWPHGVNAMGDALRRLAPELRKIGIDVRSHRGRQRSWEITKLPTPSTSSSTPSTPSTSDGTEESAVDDDDDLDGPPMEVARDFDL